MTKIKKKVNGENILYHYIQKNILDTDNITLFQKQLIEHLIIDLSIWVPLNVYKKIPLLLPFVVRDLSCRQKVEFTNFDEWGTSNNFGYLRDDNSLIKNIFGACPIQSKNIKEYNRSYLGNGFVASHIWRKVNGSKSLASTIPQTNSFIPNLVWLPKQISKLTDREMSYAQQLLQSISYQIYGKINKDSYTKEIWKYLPSSNMRSKVNLENINFFVVTDEWLNKKSKKLQAEMKHLLDIVQKPKTNLNKVKCSKYTPTLKNNLALKNKKEFVHWINKSIKRIV